MDIETLYYYIGIPVVLKEDSAEYSQLKRGKEGMIVDSESLKGEKYCLVTFNDITGTFNIPYSNITPVKSEDYINKYIKFKEEKKKEFDSAYNILLILNSKGNFNCLSYIYTDRYGVKHSNSSTLKSQAKDILLYFRASGKRIKVEKLNNPKSIK